VIEEPYFLSPQNPAATSEQRDFENRALALLQRPELLRTRSIVELLYRNATAYPAREQWDRFDNMIDEYLFHCALAGVNADGNYPGVVRVEQAAGHWFGRDVPGSRRGGGPSPFFTYRNIPISPEGRYEIRGRVNGQNAPMVVYSLMVPTPVTQTVDMIEDGDIPPGPDGEFTITIDASPAAGRSNHLQTRPGAELQLLVRDTLADWHTQTPNFLRVRRLDAPTRDPLSDDEIASRVSRFAIDSLYLFYYYSQSGNGQPPNQLRAPETSGPYGGMATQRTSMANLQLADDEALVIRANAAGARYRDTQLCDQFFLPLDAWSRSGALNMTQMAADEDGEFTYVVAHRDPGVHNWLDTGGLNRTIWGHRWQHFPQGEEHPAPTVSAQLVKHARLDDHLGAGVRRITPAERVQQLAYREAGARRMFIDS